MIVPLPVLRATCTVGLVLNLIDALALSDVWIAGSAGDLIAAALWTFVLVESRVR